MTNDVPRWFVLPLQCGWLLAGVLAGILPGTASLSAAVVINEIHYHPVEEPSFDANGLPVLDLTEDVHEFIELFNPGTGSVSLAGWELSGGIHFDFPDGTVIAGGQYLVVAKTPARLAAIAQYGLAINQVFGPWSGGLGNSGDTVRLKNDRGDVVDSVSYSSAFPWAVGANALGADQEWTGLKASDYQYRGRSLERVSATWAANDPANWLASPAPGNPTPGRPNTVTRATPAPVVIHFAAYQSADGDPLLHASQTVRIDCTFSATNPLSGVVLEYFLDDINSTTEPRTTVAMSGAGVQFTALLAGQPDRTLVRYRFRADRGAGVETVSPRADDPFGWHAYFVTPLRSSTNRVYDCFISAASLNTLNTNISQNPRRTTTPNPPGTPRDSWNATEPAVVVVDGEVFDIRMRYHGSPFRRSASRNSFKWQFPDYHKFEGQGGVFVTDKTTEYFTASGLYRAAGLPFATVRWVDFYLNANALLVRLEETEMDGPFFERFAKEWQDANPGAAREAAGEFYKSQGTMLGGDPEGPFGAGTFYRMPARAPYWTELDRYAWTYALQMHGWKGHASLMSLAQGLWTARASTNSPDLTALRAFFEANFDMDATLNYLAIRNWSCGWDDIFQNYFLWRRANGKWAMLPWDVDSEIGGRPTTTSIYIGELGDASNFWTGPNWLKDSLFKTFRAEYKERLFRLNNTLLNPTNIAAMGFANSLTFANGRFTSVNSQLALGVFQRPQRPVNNAPANGLAVLPGAALQCSAYAHSATPATPHATTTWFIRASDGTYAAPLLKLTTASNLTTLPIPFEGLAFGETYFWKCLQTDAAGHPSLESAETAFVFGAVPTPMPVVALDATTLWRYNQSGTNPPANWTAPGFDDSAWPQGAALLGVAGGAVPEAVRTTLTAGSGKITFYFRTVFDFNGDPATTRLRLRHVVDDGVVIYLNGIEVLRTGMNDGDVLSSTPAARNVVNAAYEGPFALPAASLVSGANVIAAEVHQFNASSTDVIFGTTLDALVPPPPGSIVLNEILADNRGSVTHGASSPDYIELYNNTDQAQDLNGLSLSDNVLLPGRYIFPPGTTIPGRGFLVVWCDDATNAPGLHTGFGIDNDGQTVALFTVNLNGYTLGDSITFGLQPADFTIGRVPAVTGAWRLTTPTPGTTNLPAALGSPAALKVNEWMATSATGPDWLEIFNPVDLPVALGGLYLTDDPATPAKSAIVPLSFIAPLGYRQFLADSDPGAGARHLDFKLNGNGEAIGLYDASLAAIDTVAFGPQTAGVSQGRLPDGGTNIVLFAATPTPGDANYLPLTSVVVNEILAHSDPPLVDAIELFNPGGLPVDISGWWLSDSRTRLQKFRVPANSVLAPGGFAVFYEGQFNADSNSPASFALDGAHGDEVYLAAAVPDGSLTGDRAGASFGPAENGVSHGRFATSQGIDFGALGARTFGAANALPKVGPVVINEIHYHPPDRADGSDNSRDEFIELRNIAATNVALFDPAHPTNTWRLRDAFDFSFPTNITLVPGEAVLIVGFDPADTYAVDALADSVGPGAKSARLFGPWSGKLDNSGDHVELVKPDAPVAAPGPDMGYVPSILVDKVHFADGAPWPAQGDGDGLSLQRRVPAGYGNEPTNWFAAAPTPGAANGSNALPLVTLTTPSNGASVIGPTNILLAATASDPDGSVAKVEFLLGGTNKLGESSGPGFNLLWPGVPLGTYTLVARARDNAGATALSPPVTIHIVSQLTTVAVTSPANEALLLAGTSMALAAAATNSVAAITNVAFLIDGVKITDDPTAPYAAPWTASAGSHTVRAVASDALGIVTTSAPVSFFAQAYVSTNTLVFATNAIWKYLDNGANLGTAYTNLDFNDSAWASGPAEFGYGDGDEATVVSFGSNTNNRYITHYFRMKFVLGSTEGISSSVLRVLRDDGAIGSLNGAEVHRSNMPTGAVTYTTFALASVNLAAETTYYPTNVSPGLFVIGTNILAFEIHQVTNNSADMSFAADLTLSRTAYGPAILTPPQGGTRTAGDTAVFSVNATGTAPLGYQWFHNSAPIPGATIATLLIGDLQASDAGVYSVTVSNSLGVVTSRAATLAVQPLLQPAVSPLTGHFVLRFDASPLRSYIIESSTNLASWNTVVTLTGLSGASEWEDPVPPAAPARFYRVVEQ